MNADEVVASIDPQEVVAWLREGDGMVGWGRVADVQTSGPDRFAQAEGYMQVGGNQVLLLVEEAIEPGAIDPAELRQRLQRAERELEAAGEDTERRRVAERDQRRLETFLKVAEGD